MRQTPPYPVAGGRKAFHLLQCPFPVILVVILCLYSLILPPSAQSFPHVVILLPMTLRVCCGIPVSVTGMLGGIYLPDRRLRRKAGEGRKEEE